MLILRGINFTEKNEYYLRYKAENFMKEKSIVNNIEEFISFHKPNNILLVWWEEELEEL